MLSALKKSARISARRDPNRMIFTIEASRLTYAGPVKRPRRSTVPHVFAAGAENTEVSNHKSVEPMPPSTFGLPLAFGVWLLPGARKLADAAVKSIGVPEIAENTPVTCQSPNTLERGPSCSHRPSGPVGRRYRKLFAKLCVESKLVRCQLRSMSAGVGIVPPLPSPFV